MRSRPPFARGSARNCSRRWCSCSGRAPTSRCAGSRGENCGSRARQSGTIFRCSDTRHPYRGSRGAIGRRRSGGAATGVRVARTRIRATGSRKRIDPSGRGRRKIPRRSANATSPVMARRSRAETGATNHQAHLAGIGRGRTSPAAIDHGANRLRARESARGRESRAGHPTIGRGRPSRLGPAHRGSRGRGSRGRASRQPTARGVTNRPGVHLAAIVPRTRAVALPTVDRAAVGGAANLGPQAASGRGSGSRQRAAGPRGPVHMALRHASGATTRTKETCSVILS
jgi:hypothetical protein